MGLAQQGPYVGLAQAGPGGMGLAQAGPGGMGLAQADAEFPGFGPP